MKHRETEKKCQIPAGTGVNNSDVEDDAENKENTWYGSSGNNGIDSKNWKDVLQTKAKHD